MNNIDLTFGRGPKTGGTQTYISNWAATFLGRASKGGSCEQTLPCFAEPYLQSSNNVGPVGRMRLEIEGGGSLKRVVMHPFYFSQDGG